MLIQPTAVLLRYHEEYLVPRATHGPKGCSSMISRVVPGLVSYPAVHAGALRSQEIEARPLIQSTQRPIAQRRDKFQHREPHSLLFTRATKRYRCCKYKVLSYLMKMYSICTSTSSPPSLSEKRPYESAVSCEQPHLQTASPPILACSSYFPASSAQPFQCRQAPEKRSRARLVGSSFNPVAPARWSPPPGTF